MPKWEEVFPDLTIGTIPLAVKLRELSLDERLSYQEGVMLRDAAGAVETLFAAATGGARLKRADDYLHDAGQVSDLTSGTIATDGHVPISGGSATNRRVQSADGAWWELAPTTDTFRRFFGR